jgi:hypothetical protein
MGRADSSVGHRGYIDKGGVFTSFDLPGSASTTINGVNDLGDNVGFYTSPSDAVIGFVGTPVPEPFNLGADACRRRGGLVPSPASTGIEGNPGTVTGWIRI